MSFHALVVDDSPEILEDVKDRLESMGHTCDCASCQDKARVFLNENKYSYVLLDLEIPVKYGRPSRLQNGQNLLSEVRKIKGYENIPIVIMTSHGKDSPQLAVDVMRCNGANDYVTKPFPEKGHTLEKAIRDALRSAGRSHAAAKKRSGKQLPPEPAHPFETGRMVFYPTHVELCGIVVCSDDHTTIRRILDILREKKPNGKYVVYSGDKLAKLVDCDGGQNSIATCIMGFRDSAYHSLYHEANIKCDRMKDIILNDRKYGYRFSEKIEIRDADDTQSAIHDPQNDIQNDPQYDAKNDGWNERQRWILQQLNAGVPLQNKHIQNRFKVTGTTVKRDLSPLRKRGLVAFKGSSKTGFWSLA
jgi:DNA-binding response OmpR family regulator